MSRTVIPRGQRDPCFMRSSKMPRNAQGRGLFRTNCVGTRLATQMIADTRVWASDREQCARNGSTTLTTVCAEFAAAAAANWVSCEIRGHQNCVARVPEPALRARGSFPRAAPPDPVCSKYRRSIRCGERQSGKRVDCHITICQRPFLLA